MKYICEYLIPIENNEERYYALSAVDKASYIHSVLIKLGYTVEIISPSYAKKTSKQRIDSISDSICIISGFSLGWSNSITKVFSRLSAMIWLFFYLLKNCERGEKVIIYHGVQNIPVFLLLKKIKKLDIVLEVEEIYSSLIGPRSNWRHVLEEKMIKSSSSFIFASEVLQRDCNKEHKPFAIAYGAYKVPPIFSEKKNDGKTHVVYAGLIEKDKVAFKSARVAKYLDGNYHVHIIGYGEQGDINLLQQEIEEIKSKTACDISYDGLKRGDDYLGFLQSCHIGLCPLSIDNTFQQACFPSKISSYLTNDLEVITTENPVLRNSKYSAFLHFVQNDSPEAFADVIKSIVFKREQTPRDLILKMDEEFCYQLKGIVS